MGTDTLYLGAVLGLRLGGLRDRLRDLVLRLGLRDLLRLFDGGGLLLDEFLSLSRLRSLSLSRSLKNYEKLLPNCCDFT